MVPVNSEGEKPKKTIKFSIIISLALSLGIIFAVLYLTVDADTIDKLSSTNIRYEFFAIAICLNCIYWFVWGWRLKILANEIGENVNISLWKSTKIVIANMFLAGITPSMAGGEPVRIYLLNKEGMSLGCSTAAVLGERLLDAIFMLICVPFAFLFFRGFINSNSANFDSTVVNYLNWGLGIGVVFFSILLALFAYTIIRPGKIKRFLIWINKKLSRFFKKKEKTNKIVERINTEVDNFHSSMKCLGGSGRKSLLKASIVTAIFWSSGFLIPSMILMGLGFPPYFLESFAAQILLLIIIMLPLTPGSAGVADVSVAGLYSGMVGTGEGSLIGVFVLLYRFVSYHMNLIAGAIFQYRIFKSVASFSMDMIQKKDEIKKCED